MCRRFRSIENGFLRAGLHRDFFALAIGDHFRAAGKLPPETLLPPRGDHPQIRRQRRGGQFKPHLVISLARRAVRDGVRPFPCRAISTIRLAMSGRAMLVPRKYWPS